MDGTSWDEVEEEEERRAGPSRSRAIEEWRCEDEDEDEDGDEEENNREDEIGHDKETDDDEEEDNDGDSDEDEEGDGSASSQRENDEAELELANHHQSTHTPTHLAQLGLGNGMDPLGFAGPSLSSSKSENDNDNNGNDDEDRSEEEYPGGKKTVVKPLTPEALAAYNAKQKRTGVVYISRIPPGMRPPKVRHLMSQYGEVGRVYLQQEDPKRAYLRKKFTSTKKAHFTEGWVEFMDKRVARSVAEMLNTQPIGGKKGTRFRDDVWTMKYLPKFKWHMLTEQVAHEAATRTARLRVELEQSKREQRDYLKHVELARVLDKRAERKRKAAEDKGLQIHEKDLLPALKKPRNWNDSERKSRDKANKTSKDNQAESNSSQLKTVLGSIF